MPPICSLCRKEISNYSQSLNQLELDGGKFAEICESCIGKFERWRRAFYAKLFPTKLSKKLPR